MSRKTSGALQIQLQTVVQALEAALSNLIEKVDALGTKIDKMPNVAKKMADGYVASFGTIAKSVEGLSSHVNKLDKIASGLTKIADGVKHFKATETQAKSIDRLTASFAGLGPAVAGFPKDVSGLTAFADSITSITKAFEGLDGKIPTVKQIGRLNSAANAIRNLGNAIKTTGKIPPDALAALKEVRGTGGGGGRGGTGGGGGTYNGPAAESSDFKQYATKGIGVALSLGLTEALKRQNVDRELSQVMAFESPNLGALISGGDSQVRASSVYTARMKRELAALQRRHGVNYEDAASALAMTARYTYGGNRAYGDVRSMSPAERLEQQSNIIENSKLMFQKTGLDMSTATNMQLSMGRDLGIKAEEYKKVRDAFIVVQRSGSLAAKDLERLASNARESSMSLGLVGDEASAYLTERLKSATALANAGIKASNTQGAMAGFFGDEKSFIFDLFAGVTDADYKSGNEANILKKQYAAMGAITAGMGNDRFGNLLRKQFMGEYAPSSMQGGPEQYWAVSGRMGEVGRQQELIDGAVKVNAAFDPIVPAMDNLSMAGQRLLGVLTGLGAVLGFGAASSAGQATAAPDQPGGQRYNPINPVEAAMWSNPFIFPVRLWKSIYNAMFGSKPTGYAQGGVVKPGASGATDSVPIMVTPGEEVLNANDPRHRNNVTNATDFFTRIGYRVTSAYRDDNPKSDHYRNRAIDIGMGHLQSPQEIAEFKSRLLADVKAQNLKVRFEEMDQYNPGTGSVSSGRHAHVYGDMAALGGAGERIGAGKLDPGRLRKSSSAPTLADSGASGAGKLDPGRLRKSSSAPTLADSGATNVFSGLSGLIASQKAQQQAPLQLDPSVMSALSNIASSNSDSSDTMAQAVSMFAQVIQRLVSNSRSSSGGSDLAEAVARGNYAFSRGA
ncbi:MAG: hypothetical protein RBS77_01470 [Candidatus Moranbacteria bacterium]|jgi:hypothetical protein|nr:hypothetical protein [Candidatus Moranbacteria bacterium]